MNEAILYENNKDWISISRADLIQVVRECALSDPMVYSYFKQYDELMSDLENFEEYGSFVRILKPESKISAYKFYDDHAGIMLVTSKTGEYAIKGTYDYDNYVSQQKVMIYINTHMLNTIIQRILRRPRVIALSTNPVNTNHWLDVQLSIKPESNKSCWIGYGIGDEFKPVKKHANDFMDSLRYAMLWEVDSSPMEPALKYCENDVNTVQKMFLNEEDVMLQPRLRIKDVIFNDPATIVFWYDGTKTVVKCQEGDEFDPEKGLAMAICKKILGSNKSQSNFNDIFKKWLPKEEEKIDHEVIGKIKNMRMTEAGLVVEGEITNPLFGSRINEILGILGE